MEAWLIILIVAAVIAIWFWATYNGLIQLKNRVEGAWSDIEVQLKRRYDLIPNLLESVKGYAGHEKSVMENVTAARTAAMGAQTPVQHAQAENMLTGALKSLFAVAEAYPDLKANQNFLELQRELRDAEDKVMAARRFYNANVVEFNTKIELFPTNLVAGMLGFKKSNLFDIPDDHAAQETPKVKF